MYVDPIEVSYPALTTAAIFHLCTAKPHSAPRYNRKFAPVLLYGKIPCGYCGRPQTTMFTVKGRTEVYGCRSHLAADKLPHDRDRDRRTPTLEGPRAISYSIVAMDTLAMRGLQEILRRRVYDEELVQQVKEERQRLISSLKQQRDTSRAEVSRLETTATRASRQIFEVDGPVPPSMWEAVEALEGELNKARRLLGALNERLDEQKRLQETADLLLSAASSFDSIIENLPWRPKSEAERKLFAAVQDCISMVTTKPRPDGTHDVSIEYVLVHGGSDGTEECPDLTQTIVFESQSVSSAVEHRRLARAERAQAISSFDRHLSDEELAALPEDLKHYYGSKLRNAVDALIVANELRLGLHLVQKSDPSFRIYGSRACKLHEPKTIRAIETALRPFRGESFAIHYNRRMPPAHSERAYFTQIRHPGLLLSITNPESGVTELSDNQFATIEGLFRKGDRRKMRSYLNDYFSALRKDVLLPLAAKSLEHLDNMRRANCIYKNWKYQELYRRLLAFEGYELPPGYIVPKRLHGSVNWSAEERLSYAELKARILASISPTQPEVRA